MTTNHRDLYPSRLDQWAPMFERLDPVIHGSEADCHNGPLSPAQLDRFERDGFINLPGFFAADDMRGFTDEFRELGADASIRQLPQVVREPDSDELRSIFAIHRLSPRFDALTRDATLLGIMRQLLGSDAYLHQSRINVKPAFTGKGFAWHSDFETWHAEDGLPRMRSISCSVALTENNEFNGPLMLVPGSHWFFVPTVGRTPENHYRWSLRKQDIGVPDSDSFRQLVDAGGIVAPKGGAGSVTVFDCNTLHASNDNLSPSIPAPIYSLSTTACTTGRCRRSAAGHRDRRFWPSHATSPGLVRSVAASAALVSAAMALPRPTRQ